MEEAAAAAEEGDAVRSSRSNSGRAITVFISLVCGAIILFSFAGILFLCVRKYTYGEDEIDEENKKV